jgi:hypothetical protein
MTLHQPTVIKLRVPKKTDKALVQEGEEIF